MRLEIYQNKIIIKLIMMKIFQ